jgi:hypothetical protein
MTINKEFNVFSVTPLGLPHSGAAIATAKAGGIGLLDWIHAVEKDWNKAVKQINITFEILGDRPRIGLRMRGNQLYRFTAVP